MKNFKQHFLNEGEVEDIDKQFDGNYPYAAGRAMGLIRNFINQVNRGVIKIVPQEKQPELISAFSSVYNQLDRAGKFAEMKTQQESRTHKEKPVFTETPGRKSWLGKRPVVFKDKTKYNRGKFKKEKLD